MDYTLQSLKDAFTNCYTDSNKSYKLYAMLLATSLDKDFILEYLSYFDELHHMTGKEVLVIGPQLINPHTLKDVPEENIWWHSLRRLYKDSRADWEDSNLKIEKKFLEFLNNQTRESYAIADLLSLDKSSMPVMIFFEELNYPDNFVIWSLADMTGKEFVIELRKLLDRLRNELNWGIEQQISSLENRLRLLNGYRYYREPIEYPMEIRQESISYDQAYKEFITTKEPYEFYINLEKFLNSFEEIKNGSYKVPTVNITNTIDKLRDGQIEEDSFEHLRKWSRRWRSRLPNSVVNTINFLHYPHRYVKNNQMVINRDDAVKNHEKASAILKLASEHLNEKRNENISKIENELSIKREASKKMPGSVLNKIRASIKSIPINTKHIDIEFEISNLYTSSSSRNQNIIPKKVFISYSHDTLEHKQKILELAQRLRSDGIDCWIDQFDENPEYGFTRWMYEQIVLSDYVLISCTPKYKIKFEAIQSKKSSGGNFEGHLILQELNDNGLRNSKFIPFTMDKFNVDISVPLILRPYRRYNIPDDYSGLVEHILGFKRIVPNPIGRYKPI